MPAPMMGESPTRLEPLQSTAALLRVQTLVDWVSRSDQFIAADAGLRKRCAATWRNKSALLSVHSSCRGNNVNRADFGVSASLDHLKPGLQKLEKRASHIGELVSHP